MPTESAHGTRRLYAQGCRCLRCRAANAAYESARCAGSRARVDAGPARARVAALQRAGLGSRQIAQLAGVARSLVTDLLAGKRPFLRQETAARLLEVRPALARGAAVPATKTWRYIDTLKREGYTKREIGYRLGRRSQQLDLGRKRVRVASALRVELLHDQLAAEHPEWY